MNIIRRAPPPEGGLEECVSHALIRSILLSRGVSGRSEVELSLHDLLHFRALAGIEEGAELLADAIAAGRRIGIAGDYDVDGMSGTALGVLALRALGAAEPVWHVPSRYDGGYGLSPQSVSSLHEHGAQLLVTVDNGITACEAVERARDLGLPVIITDHHDCPPQLPRAAAVINPRQPGCAFPSKHLAGVGVLFYLLAAARSRLSARGFYPDGAPCLSDFLDLVALGTIGDLAELDANNRRLVHAGLERMRRGTMQPGLRALLQVAGRAPDEVSTSTLAFEICPRLNSAMRLHLDHNPAMDCLLATDPQAALELARELDYCNRRRTDHQRVMYETALELAQAQDDGHSALVISDDSFLSGFTGLVAGQLQERFARPCFVFAAHGGVLTGSGRCSGGLELSALLQQLEERFPGLMLRHGGHAQAAGVTLEEGRLAEFAAGFRELAAARDLQASPPHLVSDGELPDECCCLEFARQLMRYGPYGRGFEEPCFDGVFQVESAYVVGGRHLSVRLRRRSGAMHGMLFRAAPEQLSLRPGTLVQVLYSVGVSYYQHRPRFEVRISHLERVGG